MTSGDTNAAAAYNDMIGEHRDAVKQLKAPSGAAKSEPAPKGSDYKSAVAVQADYIAPGKIGQAGRPA